MREKKVLGELDKVIQYILHEDGKVINRSIRA